MFRHLLSASVLLATVPAIAQGGLGPMEHGRGAGGPGAGMRNPVTNEPYSATFTSTSTEKLQDGTVLTNTTTRVVARDSLGRTREEVTMPASHGDSKPHTMIMITDPVARTITQLHPDKKLAVVRSLPQIPVGPHGDRTPPPPTAGSAAVNVRGPHEEKNVVRTDLGSKTISGVVASGTRTTRTIPAGTMGNSAPIVSTHEDWFSPDLKIEVGRTDSDPFRGTHTVAASALTKAEPDAALFKVPADYMVQQAPEHAFGGHRGPGGPHGGVPPAPPADVPVPPPAM